MKTRLLPLASLLTVLATISLPASAGSYSNQGAKPTTLNASFLHHSTIEVKSNHSVAATADKLEQVLTSKGMTVFTRIDHQKNAAGVNLKLAPTQVVIFGNPKIGTKLMQCSQGTAIDLPQKALIRQDEKGQVWLSYNNPAYLKARHQIEGCDAVIGKVENALAKFAKAATN
ncbi:DUF302 domain-containing protein [Pelagibaculum spongiae]|uniref:DUF302 domain-containing protein n=1 Tax=Pelagibaculum spongiae TaxID=2080658 RepID=A0A2V1H527_9GAMM|nr:DUF302 domain-containing protein [Pelagibaculum spongiae]PVZ72338.1 hypothetical protein DC094_04845 [Pelagibaculum spongiae]